MYKYLEPVCPLFLRLKPPEEGPFHSKTGSFDGFQVVYIHPQLLFMLYSTIVYHLEVVDKILLSAAYTPVIPSQLRCLNV